MADDPDVSPLSALQALEPVVHEYFEPAEAGSTGL